jgi:DNA-binding transcriptional ArsR family regulator
MARTLVTSDAFQAVAAPRRRQILDLLADGERPVNDLVSSLGLAQPQVSKHLRVLRGVGLVSVRGSGQQRLYKLNVEGLKPIHDWVRSVERIWDHQLDRIKEEAERIARERATAQVRAQGRRASQQAARKTVSGASAKDALVVFSGTSAGDSQ